MQTLERPVSKDQDVYEDAQIKIAELKMQMDVIRSQYISLADASEMTGLSRYYLRKEIVSGHCQYLRDGKNVYIHKNDIQYLIDGLKTDVFIRNLSGDSNEFNMG